MNQALGNKVLNENNAFENKNISENGCAPASYSEISAELLTDGLTGIFSFN